MKACTRKYQKNGLFPIVVAVLYAASLRSPGQANPRGGTVTGHVYCSDVHGPCRFATITLERKSSVAKQTADEDQTGDSSYSARTDLVGGYELRGVPPGTYYVGAHYAGYLSPHEMAASLFPLGSASAKRAVDIAVSQIVVAQDRVTVYDVSMFRGGSVSGSISYDDGNPASNLPVHLLRRDANKRWTVYHNAAGNSLFAQLGFGPHTDDRGRFYEPGLPPGTYTIEVTLPSVSASANSVVNSQSLSINQSSGDAMAYYLGQTFSIGDAKEFVLAADGSNMDVSIEIPTRDLRMFSGQVMFSTTGIKVSNASLTLRDLSNPLATRQLRTESDGSFAFHYLPDGSYSLTVEAIDMGNSLSHFETLTQAVTLIDDIRDVQLKVHPTEK